MNPATTFLTVNLFDVLSGIPFSALQGANPFNHGSQTWLRTDGETPMPVTELTRVWWGDVSM